MEDYITRKKRMGKKVKKEECPFTGIIQSIKEKRAELGLEILVDDVRSIRNSVIRMNWVVALLMLANFALYVEVLFIAILIK